MKKYISLLLLLIFTISAFSQIKFEKAYFIDNNGVKTECLIKNDDWKNNPDIIVYKLSEPGDKLSSSIKNIIEFEIYGETKYERHIVNIDVSTQDLQKMDSNRRPIWEKQTLFLKVLIEGNTMLYKYTNNNTGSKYFYKTNTSNIKQLVSKYMTKI